MFLLVLERERKRAPRSWSKAEVSRENAEVCGKGLVGARKSVRYATGKVCVELVVVQEEGTGGRSRDGKQQAMAPAVDVDV